MLKALLRKCTGQGLFSCVTYNYPNIQIRLSVQGEIALQTRLFLKNNSGLLFSNLNNNIFRC
jgi:hypothetical protein